MISVFCLQGRWFLPAGLHPAFDPSSLLTVRAEMGRKSELLSPRSG